MTENNNHLHECAHCAGTGICNHGQEGEACAACVKYHELNKSKKYFGLACGTCGGLGKAETLTYRLNNRMTPLLALSIVSMCFVLISIFGLMKNEYFSEVLAFCGTLSGAVVGHYFGRKSQKQIEEK